MEYMPRPRLDETFDQAARCKLVYVIAGTGSGKTQAVRHYIEGQQGAVVRWIQLAESDNIASRFWEKFTHAVSIDFPDLATKLRELGFPETLARFKQFAEIVRDIKPRDQRAFFVLDDFHLIHSPEGLVFTERCANLDIPGACVIILSRTEPAVNMVSSFSLGKIGVVTENELRFTAAEAAEFFRMREIPCSAEDIAQLIKATKGWALAINMFALILKRIPNNFKHALDAMRQNIFKLLELEAWGGFPEQVQKAMVRVSLLSELPTLPLGELFDDTAFLQDTPGLSSFVWFDSFTNDFKIHPLYLEFLQSKRHILSEEEARETYQRAAQWCAEHEFHMDAMRYWAKLGQYTRIVELFLSYPFRLPRDVSAYFLTILENLEPDEAAQNDPGLLFLQNYFTPLLLAGTGRYEEARERALAAVHTWEHVEGPLATVLLYSIYSGLAYIDMYTCTVTHTYRGPEYLQKSVEHFNRSTVPSAEMAGAFINADLRSFACLVGEGAALSEFDAFLEAAERTEALIAQTPYNIYAGYADLVSCEYAFFKNQPELARSHAHKAILKAREKRQYSIVALAEKYLLHIAMREGNTSLVKELLKQLNTHLDNPDFWNRQLYYDLYVGLFYAKMGLPQQGPRWFLMDEKEAASEFHIPARELHVGAWYHIAAQKYQQALTILGNCHPREPQERFLFGETRLALLTAVARIQTGDVAGAMAAFEQAYALSFEGVFELFFIELGKELRPLVVAALKQKNSGIPAEWLKTIDRKASIYAKKVAVVANAFRDEVDCKAPVSLSDREREVLLDLYHGLSREEIATHRYLSINTVKKILQSIYIKLDAHNNVDAVRIALEKKLIE